MGSEADPGFLASLGGSATPLSVLRLLSVAMAGVIPLITGVMVVVIGVEFAFTPIAIALPAVGLGAVAAAFLLRPAPLDTDLTPGAAGHQAVLRANSTTLVRLALCEAAVMLGLVGAFLGEMSLTPLLAGAVISLLGMAMVALPTRSTIEEYRERLESRGATSYLWNGLTDPDRPRAGDEVPGQ
ncbi:hypothetical protein Nans01_32350 [Nocardiopsis ansamitocini]|uniref:Uncharacterized protein n=1 Tax=Nocardiopsis ansamitocini TaxID=1670832 RepID=A0A9W6P7F7_9ACTN|nr:hypothetical protein Nans01_32350 [Nocardiopsis ansamitocini]